MRQRNPLSKPKMNQEFFTDLPSEMIIDLLSRLPVRTIISCKCVCKSWLNLLETDEFVKSHLSKSVPGLAVNGEELCKIFEFEDVLDLERHELHYIPVTEFKSTDYGLSNYGVIQGSANGLLFLFNPIIPSRIPDELYLINPVTFEYIKISCCQEFTYGDHQLVVYGFGASRITGQLKVVRIFHDCIHDQETKELRSIPKSDCHVYTLGTGSWRSTTRGPLMEYDHFSFGAFLYGNLHWLVFDLNGCPWISCFDLEDELFSTFSAPPVVRGHRREDRRILLGLYALEDCLCLSDNVTDDEFVIWFMKDFGVKKSWTKDFVISKRQSPSFVLPDKDIAYPIKVFKDGDILMTWDRLHVFYYSSKTKTTHEIDIFDRNTTIDPILHTSSFLSLKSFVKEKVTSFWN